MTQIDEFHQNDVTLSSGSISFEKFQLSSIVSELSLNLTSKGHRKGFGTF